MRYDVTANRVLRETLRLNKIEGVEVLDFALSDGVLQLSKRGEQEGEAE